MSKAGEQAAIIFESKAGRTVWSAERAEVSDDPVAPRCGVLSLVAGQIRISRDPTLIVDAVGLTLRSTECAENGDGVTWQIVVRFRLICCEAC